MINGSLIQEPLIMFVTLQWFKHSTSIEEGQR